MGIFNMFKKQPEDTSSAKRSGLLVDAKDKPKIGKEEIQKARRLLDDYRNGKAVLEAKTVENEDFWKQRQYECFQRPDGNRWIPASAWLWNCIVNKYSQFVEAYPSFNILPQAEDDQAEADVLSTIIPVVLRQAGYEKTYTQVSRYKVIQGTGITGVFWDGNADNGLGRIVIKKADILNLFWEPGVTDIQDSPHFFAVSLVNAETLDELYPEHKGEFKKNSDTVANYNYDDTVDTSKKALVVEWYYKKAVNGRYTVQYCKFVGDIVLYATENDTESLVDKDGNAVRLAASETGLYADGKYPYVFDPLFPIEGTPCGYGYTDIGKDTQIQIDALNNAITQNALMASKPRWMYREDVGVNMGVYADWTQPFIPVASGDLSDNNIKQVNVNNLSGTYVSILHDRINELKETLGNRDVNTGGAVSGVTAASAIAALQEAGGKVDRATIQETYFAQEQICQMVISRIEQFYTVSRRFRILDELGDAKFIEYKTKADNSGFPELPFFDIDITAEKASSYSSMAQNELMLQFYGAGFFNPANAQQASACLSGMDFRGKEKVLKTIQSNNTMLQQLVKLAGIVDKLTGSNVTNQITLNAGGNVNIPESKNTGREPEHVEKARQQTQEATQPR